MRGHRGRFVPASLSPAWKPRPPADRPGARSPPVLFDCGLRSHPRPHPTMCSGPTCRHARPAVLSLPSWGSLSPGREACMSVPAGVCSHVSPDFSGPTVGRAGPGPADLPVYMPFLETPVCISRLLFPFSTSIRTHSSQLFPLIFQGRQQCKATVTPSSKVSPIIRFPLLEIVCVYTLPHSGRERK